MPNNPIYQEVPKSNLILGVGVSRVGKQKSKAVTQCSKHQPFQSLFLKDSKWMYSLSQVFH